MVAINQGIPMGAGIVMMFYILVALLLLVVQIVACWKVFEKAGEPGWKAIIPVYSEYVLYKIAWDVKPFWILIGAAVVNMLLCWIPVVGTIIGFIVGSLAIIIEVSCYVKLSKAFGHGGWFAVGLLLLSPVFIMILGFENSEYLGPQE